MKKSLCLCFSDRGLFNRRDIKLIETYSAINTIVLASDGTEKSLEHIAKFQDNPILKRHGIQRVGIARTPKCEMRVISPEGVVSDPNYILAKEDENKWLCAKVAAPLVKIFLSDITSQGGTQALLEKEATETVCFLAHKLWSLLLIVEERLCFPAVVIDQMTRWTYQLTPNTIDIALLRRETGLKTLDYNSTSDILSVEVASEIFTVKLSVLNEVYGSLILPFFNRLYGRRLRMVVSIMTYGGHSTEPTEMSYGQLGSIIEGMRVYVKKRDITNDDPIHIRSLFEWAKKVRIDDESCIWLTPNETLSSVIEAHRDQFVSASIEEHTTDERDSVVAA